MSEENTLPPETPKTNNTKKRIVLFSGLAIIVAIGAFGVDYYNKNIGNRYVKTDNAYAAAEVAQVTPSITGTISEINVIDTQFVNKGDVLVHIDSADAELAVRQAEAEYQVIIRKVTGAMASDKQFGAQIIARQADKLSAEAKLSSANADLEKAKADLARRQNLLAAGAVTADEITIAKHNLESAIAGVSAAKAAITQANANTLAAEGTRVTNSASFANSTIENNPEVLLAAAKLKRAQIDYDRATIIAPVSGVVARRQIQLGQRVQAGSTLMEIVPINEIHVDANFKEGQLKSVKLGQKVEVTSDLYGEKIVYHGKVAGISGGTGSAFSLIPAQNATGNWIKVVQRLPVRINLDKQDLVKHPLKIGLSMSVKIDTKEK